MALSADAGPVTIADPAGNAWEIAQELPEAVLVSAENGPWPEMTPSRRWDVNYARVKSSAYTLPWAYQPWT